MSIVYAETIPTESIGRVRFAFDDSGYLQEVKMRSASRSGSVGMAPAGTPSRAKLERWLKAYLKGKDVSFPGKWQIPGNTEFSRAVYTKVAAIKPGETLSYGEVAAKVGSAKACRAVGTAMGRNPLSLVVP